MSWVVCGYYTKDKIYEGHAKTFINSLKSFNIPYDVTPIESTNDWYEGMQQKPQFLLDMLQKYKPHSIVYVDVDAVFCQYPHLFDKIDKSMPDINIALHVLDHTKFRRKNHAPEVLSGTIFLRNTNETCIILREWMTELKKDSKLWDQKGLAKVLRNRSFYILPEEYCTIFDYMSSVKDPVIKHFQASREAKATKIRPKARLRVVNSNNVLVKLGRKFK